MISLSREEFQRLVAEAIDGLPKDFRDRLKNIAVIVEDFPSPQIAADMKLRSPWDLFGLYHGVPFEHRGPYYGNLAPDVILIFQKPIERFSETEAEIREEIRATVVHEVGHYFGFNDAELRRIERDLRRPDKDMSHEQALSRDLPRPHHPVRRRRHRRQPAP